MTPAWVRLTLDVDAFDDRAFADVRQQCSREGIVLTTMAELGDLDANHRRLYELNRACSAELGVPEIRTFHHPDNEAPISLNRKLGYVDAEAVRPPP